jgi:hypothetical protein
MTTETEERPPRPAETRRVRRVVLALVAVAAVAGAGWWARDVQTNSMSGGDLKASFPDISDPQWTCGSDAESDLYQYSCYRVPDGEFGPTVNFVALREPMSMDETIDRRQEAHREAERQDQSPLESELRLLGTEEWAPEGSAEPWGSVARWRFENPNDDFVVYEATFRYADKPFGVSVYARTPEEIDKVVASLTIPAPAELPG